jgi:hypothetical protein
MGSSAAVVVVVWLGLLMAIRWLGRQSRTGDGKSTVEWQAREWSTELEDGRRWKMAGTGRTTENKRWPKMENEGGGSCVVVDGGKKMGRWREGGKIWGEALK